MPRSMVAVGVAALLFASAGAKVDDDSCSDNGDPFTVTLGADVCYTLYAGQTIDVGVVCTTLIDPDSGSGVAALKVEFKDFKDDWKLKEAHLWIGHTMDYPSTRQGNPKIGNFPYHSGTLSPPVTSYVFDMIPLPQVTGLCGYCPIDDPQCMCTVPFIYMMAHASVCKVGVNGEVIQEETGWPGVDGACLAVVERGSWATVCDVPLDVECCEDADCDRGGNGGTSETAYARDPSEASEDPPTPGSKCFDKIDDELNRWGWSNGAYPDDCPAAPLLLDIYAGAGQCDWQTKGTKIGTLTFQYCSGQIRVTYSINADATGWSFTEFHLYVGNDILPQKGDPAAWTVAPGHYPYSHTCTQGTPCTTHQFSLPESEADPFTGPVYVVAHAVAVQSPP